jgi:hypothetical protein
MHRGSRGEQLYRDPSGRVLKLTTSGEFLPYDMRRGGNQKRNKTKKRTNN